MITIAKDFPVTSDEYAELEKELGRLCYKAAWVLKERNYNNNFYDDTEDIVQQFRIDMMRAASYYKRQTYIESCLAALEEHVEDKFIKHVIDVLWSLWKDRKRHGAYRQKFGPYQEAILERLVRKHVPKEYRPDRDAMLVVSDDFRVYCKHVIWNSQRSMGKKITRDKSWRSGLVSLSEFDYHAVA